jgi:hypothetical protein
MAATTADEVWALLRELLEAQKETDRKFQETDRQLQERVQETDRRIQERAQETDRRIQETDRQIQEVNRQLGRLGGQWGLFVENLVAPSCERLFTERGIPVHMVSRRVLKRKDGDTLEIDVLVVNLGHVVMVEVKSSLRVDDVKELLEDLRRFRHFFPEYADHQLHGAVAGMRIEEGADRFAYRQGLFVLAQTGDSMRILNDAAFEPKSW